MKQIIRNTILLCMLSINAMHAQIPEVSPLNKAFTFGEKLTFKAKYSLYVNVPVGELKVQVQATPQDMNGSSCFHLTAKGKTFGFYDPFFKIRDNYESFIDLATMKTMYSSRDVNEGSFSFNETVVFDPKAKTAQTKKRTQKIPDTTMDVLSTLYYARNVDFTNAQPGQQYMFCTFIDDSAYRVGMEYVGKEVIKTDAGKFRCIKLKPLLVKDRIFKSKEDMALWITDDDNHIPILVMSGISVGSIKMELTAYENLKNPLNSKL